MNKPFHFAVPPLLLALAACSGPSTSPSQAEAEVPTEETVETQPVDLFLERIATHCGQAFAGRIVANDPPPEAEDPFTGKPLVMHVRECHDDGINIPFHVGDDHSRTWVLTRTEDGLRLKHDHRHEDGSEDVLTMYGGDTTSAGTEVRQEFPVDVESQELFNREGLTVSTTNVWAMEIEPGQSFAYELARPGRLFRVEFDLTEPVDTPPTPWGHD
ncbi:hypothetical protein [Marilutibacter alkalisoli]|uniref:Secreted protein n=1 Tax=Marilutibacter alkalisoli TaxID=2591633 RepID=A0A514BNY7_9GAMM|nr:hypothetical protein [Lysobacter alkalisoli]QDH69104.1 hypothetical protein FKV23_02535 [Lysobacter alkalisoli]